MFYRWIRNLHLGFALFAASGLLLYSWSALQMTHPSFFSSFSSKPVLESSAARLRERIENPRQAAKLLLDRGLVRGELDEVKDTPDGFHLRMVRPGTVYAIEYHRDSGITEVHSARQPFLGMLNRLHNSAGIWHEFWPTRVWTYYVALLSSLLIGVGVTGIYLWWVRRKDRWIGFVLLGLNWAVTLTLLALVRFGPGW